MIDLKNNVILLFKMWVENRNQNIKFWINYGKYIGYF